MNDEINYKNNPLHGVGLKNLLTELVDHYGFEILFAYLNINSFKNNPSIESSVKFLKKTEWAREKVEAFYLYKFKNLPDVSPEQFSLSPRDRVIPDDQKPGKPAELSLEEAEQLREESEEKAAEWEKNRGSHSNSDKSFDRQRREHSFNRGRERSTHPDHESLDSPDATANGNRDPWEKWKN